MLGEQIGQEKGRVTGRRVLSADPAKMEVAFESEGSLLGVPVKDVGTYWSVFRPDGSLYGEGQGITMTKTGEAIAWKGQGIGRLGENGAVSYRGALYYQTGSERFKRLNTVAIVFEYDVDAEGKTASKSWEWR